MKSEANANRCPIQHLAGPALLKMASFHLVPMIECVYRNETDRMVIVKCVGRDQFYREKVVLPTELFWFEAPEDARLEIWKMSVTGQMLHVRADVTDFAMNEDAATESLWAC